MLQNMATYLELSMNCFWKCNVEMFDDIRNMCWMKDDGTRLQHSISPMAANMDNTQRCTKNISIMQCLDLLDGFAGCTTSLFSMLKTLAVTVSTSMSTFTARFGAWEVLTDMLTIVIAANCKRSLQERQSGSHGERDNQGESSLQGETANR